MVKLVGTIRVPTVLFKNLLGEYFHTLPTDVMILITYWKVSDIKLNYYYYYYYYSN